MTVHAQDLQAPAKASRRDPARTHLFAKQPGRARISSLAEAADRLLAQMDDTAAPAQIPPRAAIRSLVAACHTLTPSIPSSAPDTWFSASAAQRGAPHGSGEHRPPDRRHHRAAACEAGDGT